METGYHNRIDNNIDSSDSTIVEDSEVSSFHINLISLKNFSVRNFGSNDFN